MTRLESSTEEHGDIDRLKKKKSSTMCILKWRLDGRFAIYNNA